MIMPSSRDVASPPSTVSDPLHPDVRTNIIIYSGDSFFINRVIASRLTDLSSIRSVYLSRLFLFLVGLKEVEESRQSATVHVPGREIFTLQHFGALESEQENDTHPSTLSCCCDSTHPRPHPPLPFSLTGVQPQRTSATHRLSLCPS